MMVRHILKKDWLLLWPLISALAVLQALFVFARFKSGPGHFATGVPTVPEAFLELLAAATVIVLVVHQDPIPGVRQDWLIRPIRRRDLFLAKLIFVVGLVQGPWWPSDLFQGLANGFSFSQSAAAATASAAWVFMMVSLPVLAFATLTATMTETFLAALAVLVVMISFVIVPALIHAADPTGLTGVAWVPDLARDVLLLVGAAGVLALQYGWRNTWTARGLFAAAIVGGRLVGFLPFRTAFGVQQLLTASSGDDREIAVTFAPGAGRYSLAPGQGVDDILEKPGFGEVDVAEENQRRRAEGARTVFLPLNVSGLIANSRLLADQSDVRLIDRSGRVLHQGTGNDLELRATGAEATIHHRHSSAWRPLQSCAGRTARRADRVFVHAVPQQGNVCPSCARWRSADARYWKVRNQFNNSPGTASSSHLALIGSPAFRWSCLRGRPFPSIHTWPGLH